MSTAEILEELKSMSREELNLVIEAATRLRQVRGTAQAGHAAGDDPLLRLAGSLSGEPIPADEIDRIIYGVEAP